VALNTIIKNIFIIFTVFVDYTDSVQKEKKMTLLYKFVTLLKGVLIVCCMTVVMILSNLPLTKKFVARQIALRSKSAFGVTIDTTVNITTIRQVWWKHMCEILYRETEIGKPAINAPIYDMRSKSFRKLLDFEKSGRPLVVNFGSCT